RFDLQLLLQLLQNIHMRHSFLRFLSVLHPRPKEERASSLPDCFINIHSTAFSKTCFLQTMTAKHTPQYGAVLGCWMLFDDHKKLIISPGSCSRYNPSGTYIMRRPS